MNTFCIMSVMTNTAEELGTTVSGLLGMDECVHYEAPPMEEDIDEYIRSMVASMCGDGEGINCSSLGVKGVSRPREVGKQVRKLYQVRFYFHLRSMRGAGRESRLGPLGTYNKNLVAIQSPTEKQSFG